MATRFATKRCCVKRNNGTAKSTTSKAGGTSVDTKSSSDNSEMSKDQQYNINHQQNFEEIESITQSSNY